jgi:hypothetical protein
MPLSSHMTRPMARVLLARAHAGQATSCRAALGGRRAYPTRKALLGA